MDNPDGRAQNLRYVVYWDGSEKWRGEWSAPGRKQITIVNNGKLSYSSNQPKPPWSTIWFEAALAALDGGTPAGPYLLPYIRNSNLRAHNAVDIRYPTRYGVISQTTPHPLPLKQPSVSPP